jgi:DNA (cytosine-5)-methyltransferase 1
MSTMKAVSLFTGAGGMDIGFQQAGFKVVWANEIMLHAASTYRENHAPEVMHCGDIQDLLADLPVGEDISCVFGGPPCQGFSVAGKMDLGDARSQLVFSFMESVERISPAVFVMENVKALATLEKFSSIRAELFRRAVEIGYSADFHLLNAKDYGVPQSRERVFFIGFKKSGNARFDPRYLERYRAAPSSIRSIFSVIGPAGTDNNPLTCRARITLADNPVMRKSPYAGMLFNGLGRPLNTDGISCTLPASMGGNKTPIVDEAHVFDGAEHWVEWYHAHLTQGGRPSDVGGVSPNLRRITLKEAAAIQTFPQDYQFSGPVSAQYTQIGNAVPCRLAFAVASAVVDAVHSSPLEESMGQSELWDG